MNFEGIQWGCTSVVTVELGDAAPRKRSRGARAVLFGPSPASPVVTAISGGGGEKGSPQRFAQRSSVGGGEDVCRWTLGSARACWEVPPPTQTRAMARKAEERKDWSIMSGDVFDSDEVEV